VPHAFHLLAKPTGAVCNLDCSYCFFLSKEMLYPGSRFRMADELLEEYLRQLIEAHKQVPEVTIAWQGGEPTLMGLEFFQRSVELAQQYLKPGQRGRLHDPDERDAPRRGVGGVLQGERLSGRDLDRRVAGDARRVPG
jgi:sulfatase maturation enzyme AslB (radical SAM superfamily)